MGSMGAGYQFLIQPMHTLTRAIQYAWLLSAPQSYSLG